MNIKWNDEDLADPEADLCTKRPNGYYDVMNGCDGWVVRTPHGKYVYATQHGWVMSDSIRGDKDAVTRNQAMEFAEQLIREYK